MDVLLLRTTLTAAPPPRIVDHAAWNLCKCYDWIHCWKIRRTRASANKLTSSRFICCSAKNQGFFPWKKMMCSGEGKGSWSAILLRHTIEVKCNKKKISMQTSHATVYTIRFIQRHFMPWCVVSSSNKSCRIFFRQLHIFSHFFKYQASYIQYFLADVTNITLLTVSSCTR